MYERLGMSWGWLSHDLFCTIVSGAVGKRKPSRANPGRWGYLGLGCPVRGGQVSQFGLSHFPFVITEGLWGLHPAKRWQCIQTQVTLQETPLTRRLAWSFVLWAWICWFDFRKACHGPRAMGGRLVGQPSFQGPALDMWSARCGDMGTQPGCSPHAGATDPTMTAQDGGRPALENHLGASVVVTSREVCAS